MELHEDEAKKKWCPFVRVGWMEKFREKPEVPAENVGYNRLVCEHKDDDSESTIMAECLCVASMCMAWRAARGSDGEFGYCGLAGKLGGE